jgi:hypothetical protein
MSNNLEYKLTLKDLFSKSMRGAQLEAQKLDDRMNRLQSGLGKIGLGLGVAALGRQILETGSMFERAEIQLTTLLKSASAAKAVFNDLKDESTRSPFGFETLLQGNAALISAGVNARAAKEDFNALADAVAATGGTEDHLQRMVFNLQQIKNTGKATAVDIKQFGMAGISIYPILEEYYKKNNIALKDQQANYEQVTGALKLAASEGGRYFGASARMAESTSGRLSNMADSFKVFINEIFVKAKPLINAVVVSLTALMDLFIKFMPLIKTLIILWGSYYLKIKLAATGTRLFAVANRAMAMGMTKAQIASVYLSRGIKGIGAAIKSVPIIGWVLALADGFMYLWDNVEGFRATLMGIVEVFKNKFAPIAEFISALFSGDLQKMQQASINWALDKTKQTESEAFSAGRVKGFTSFRKEKMLEAGGDLTTLTDLKDPKDPKDPTSLGSGTEVSGRAPKNLYINITKLVEELNINTTNMQEGAGKIKEMVSKALLEAVNDVNLMSAR